MVADARLRHPGDIVKFKGRYVATEIYDNRLAVFDDLALNNLEHFDPGRIGKELESPHFLAVTSRDTLLISNGWGSSIVEIEDLDGSGWKEFSGVGREFDAPHGVCVDDEGWIYVGDSLNSRLVRFKDMAGTGWEVFPDLDRRVSYIRELACHDGAVWAANSYENRPGLNPGRGGNILKITDFGSGKAEIVYAFTESNVTGILPIGDAAVLVGEWGLRMRLALLDTSNGTLQVFPRLEQGIPYGTFHDRAAARVLVAHIGNLSKGERENIGGIGVYGR